MTITLTGTEYVAAGSLQAGQFASSDNLSGTIVMSGTVTVSMVSRTDATNAVLTLAYDGTDFDTDGSITLFIFPEAHTGSLVLTVRTGATGIVTLLPVTAVVENNNANLSALTLSAGMLTPAFDAATTTYAAMVDNSVSSLTLTPTVANAFATITVDGEAVASGVASGSVDLAEGANAIAVVVTATDGSTTQTYTVTVTRAAATPVLSIDPPTGDVASSLTFTIRNTGGGILAANAAGITFFRSRDEYTTAADPIAANVAGAQSCSGSNEAVIGTPCAIGTINIPSALAANTGTFDSILTTSLALPIPADGNNYYYFLCVTITATSVTTCSPTSDARNIPDPLPNLSATSAAFTSSLNLPTANEAGVTVTSLTAGQSGLTLDVAVVNTGAAATAAMIQVYRSPTAVVAGSPPTATTCGGDNVLCAVGSPRDVGAFASGGATPQTSATFTASSTDGLYHYFACFTDAAETTDRQADNCTPSTPARVGDPPVTFGGTDTERALQKTLAAFGRAFATGTVGVFEDYLTNTGTSANTSHFTIGGHKFELATNTPAQTLDSRVASVRKPLTRQRTLTLENDGSVVNTPSASYPQKYKSPSVSFPNDRKTGSDSDHVFHRIGNPVEHDLADTINSANLADTTSNGATTGTPTPATTTLMPPRDLLMKSAFHLNLNNAAPGTPSWSLWARATTSNFDGKPENDFEQDGDVTSAYLGTDYRTPTGVRLGVAISESNGEIDYDDQADDIQGDLQADLTSILPYIQWQPNATTNAWVVLGYGEGEAELSTDGDDETTDVDIEMQMIAAGVSGDLTTWKRSEWSWKASVFAVELESEADEATDLPAVTADSQRLRLAMQGRAPGTPSPNGTQLTPNWELGLRWDDGDAEQGGGADLGLGFDYRHPASGLSMQGKASALVAHEEEDYEEWNASLQVRYDPGARGRGITFTLEPGWSEDGRSQKMGVDFSNALGKWTKRGLRLELTGERTERDDDNIGHNIRLTGSLRF